MKDMALSTRDPAFFLWTKKSTAPPARLSQEEHEPCWHKIIPWKEECPSVNRQEMVSLGLLSSFKRLKR